MSDRDLVKKADAGHVLGLNLTDPIGAVNNVHSETFCTRFHSAETNAVTNVSETSVAVLYKSAQLAKASWNGDINIASNGSNYALFKVYARESGGSQRLIASGNTANASATRWTSYDLAPNTTSNAYQVNANFAAPAVITYEVTKISSGVAVNTGALALEFQYGGT